MSLLDELASSLPRVDRASLASVAHVRPPDISFPDVAKRSAVLREQALRGSDAQLIVCAGRLVESKRWGPAMEHVARSFAGSRVVMVGDGPERARLESKAHALGVNVRFVGKTTRDEAVAWIGAADMLLHASRAEGLSTVIREAEALGVPVVRIG